MQINYWHQNNSICEKDEQLFFELFDPKISITPLGWPPMGKNHQNFFSILGIRMAQFAKRKQKNISNFLSQKHSITPAGVTSNGQKSPKIFLSFLASEWLNSRKKAKKKFWPKLGPGMCGMWPKKGSKWFYG